MKKKSFAIAAAAVSLSAALSLTVFSDPLKTIADFITGANSASDIIIDEDLIDISITPYNDFSKDIAVSINENIITSDVTDCEMLDRINITIGISTTNCLYDDWLDSVNLYVYHTLNGTECSVRTISPSAVYIISDTEFELSYDFTTYGTDMYFDTSYLSGAEGITAEYCTMTGNGSDYVKAETFTPDGENLFVSTRAGIDEEKLSRWLKTVTMYLNSLKDVTGISRDTMYMLFDDPDCPTAYSANYMLDNTKATNGFTVFGIDTTEEVLRVIDEQCDAVTWCVMHEISHSYAGHVADSTFEKNYNYHDEVHTNVRGITAIHNCCNLQDIIIADNGIEGYYYDIYDKRNPPSDDHLYYMAKKMTIIGSEFGWDKLETFFRAADDAGYDHDYYSEANLHAAEVLKDALELEVSLDNPDYLKFVNVLHRLYVLCLNPYEFDEEDFNLYVESQYNGGSETDNSNTNLIQQFVYANIETPLNIIRQPENSSAPIGKTVSVSVEASGEELSYQWFYRESNGKAFVPTGVDSPDFSYTLTEKNNGRQLYCRITDKYGKTEVTDTVTTYAPVDIIKHPESTSVRLNGTVLLSIEAEGSGLTYNWYEHAPNTNSWDKIDISNSTYSCRMTSDKIGTRVYCIVTDKYGETAVSNVATIGIPTSITKQPANITAVIGTRTSVNVKATGTNLKYKWYIKDQDSNKWVVTNTNSSTYSFIMSKKTCNRLAYCEITDDFGNVTKSNTIIIKGSLKK